LKNQKNNIPMKILNYLTSVLENLPKDWLYSTTHRLDIYNEQLAKKEFLEQFNELYNNKILANLL